MNFYVFVIIRNKFICWKKWLEEDFLEFNGDVVVVIMMVLLVVYVN